MPNTSNIEEIAHDWAIDYKPWETDLDYREYAREGFEQGYKRAEKELKKTDEEMVDYLFQNNLITYEAMVEAHAKISNRNQPKPEPVKETSPEPAEPKEHWTKKFFEMEVDLIEDLAEHGIEWSDHARGGKMYSDGGKYGVRVCFTSCGEVIICNENIYSGNSYTYYYSESKGNYDKILKGTYKAVLRRLKAQKETA